MNSSYQLEQLETLEAVHRRISELTSTEQKRLGEECSDYLVFRDDVDQFLSQNFSNICTKSCYVNRRSACCSREGIITFFADVVVNALFSEPGAIEFLLTRLKGEGRPGKCIYPGDEGCLWHVKPIVCEMFLCNDAKNRVFEQHPASRREWHELEERRKGFTWPDRLVLFDDLERYFIGAGITSPLMYFHNSPGLLRLKQKAGLDAGGMRNEGKSNA